LCVLDELRELGLEVGHRDRRVVGHAFFALKVRVVDAAEADTEGGNLVRRSCLRLKALARKTAARVVATTRRL
jgi:hypothetical protein